MRLYKTEEEIEIMKRAQKITDMAFSHILEFIKPDMTEKMCIRDSSLTDPKVAENMYVYNQTFINATKVELNPSNGTENVTINGQSYSNGYTQKSASSNYTNLVIAENTATNKKV